MGYDETCSALCVMSDPDKVVFARSDKFGNGTNIIIWDLLGNQPIKEMRYDAPVGKFEYLKHAVTFDVIHRMLVYLIR